MDRDNFYIILELDFDKPEQDMNVINAAIEAKQAEWSKNRNHPRLGTKMLQYLSMIDRIKRVMGDDKSREAEALAARKIAYEPLDRQLAIVCQKKKITSSEINFLSRKYKLSPEKIKARVPKNVQITDDEQKQSAQAKLDSVIAKKIKDNLEIVQKKDLYEFLEIDRTADCEQIGGAADRIYSVYAKKPKNAENEAICTLAGICKAQLADKGKRALYDAYLSERGLDDIREMIDLAAAGGQIDGAASGEIIRQIMARGYSRDAAVAALKEHCAKKKYCLVLDGGAEQRLFRRCGACGANVEISDNVRACTSCGAPLFVECPSCGTVNQTSNNNCLKCGFSIKDMFAADGEIKAAQTYIEELMFDRAEQMLANAEKHYPGREDCRKLRQRLESLRSEVEKYKRELDKSVEQKRFFAAEEQYAALKQKLGGYSDAALESRIKTAINSARQLAERAKKCADERSAVELCVSATEQCADCAEAKNILLGYKLCPAENVSVSVRGMTNSISWSKSKSCGAITYRVVKKAYSLPENENDGQTLCEIDGTAFDDKNTNCAEPTYYAVFARRGGITAAPAAFARPVYNLEEPSDVTVRSEDGAVNLIWNMPDGAVCAEIQRGDGFIPDDARSSKSFTAKQSAIRDQGLTNGKQYFYRIYAVYEADRSRMRSAGVTVKAVPDEQPEPIKNIWLSREQDQAYSISFDVPKKGRLELYYSDKEAVFDEGQIITAAQAEQTVKKLKITSEQPGKISFNADFAELAYIYPMVVCGTNAAVCKCFRISRVRGFLEKSKPTFGTDKLYIELEWPQNADAALLLYRFDRFPTGAEDSEAAREFITARSYRTQGAAIIPNVQKRDYYITVFAVYKDGSDKIYSDGLDIFAAGGEITEIHYAIKCKRTLFGKIKSVMLEVSCVSPLNVLPRMQLVRKANILPLNKTDGMVVLTTDFKEPVNRQTLQFENDSLTKTTCYKLFFADDSNYEKYKITTTDISGLTITG